METTLVKATYTLSNRDIQDGWDNKHNSEQCPVALCLKRHGLTRPTVGAFTAHCAMEGEFMGAKLPIWLTEAIAGFDHGKGMLPFTFTLEWEPC
jgi:hypothetical protein